MKLLLMASAVALVTAGCVPSDVVQRNLPHQRDSDSSSLRIGMFKPHAPLPDRGVGSEDAAERVEEEASTEVPASQDADEDNTAPTTGDEQDAASEDETTPGNDNEVVPDNVTPPVTTPPAATPPVRGGGPNRVNPSCENSGGNANTCG